MLMACFWRDLLACSCLAFGMLLASSWRAPGMLLYASGVLLTYFWHVLGKLWHASGMSLPCFEHAHGVVLTCSWLVHSMHQVFFWQECLDLSGSHRHSNGFQKESWEGTQEGFPRYCNGFQEDSQALQLISRGISLGNLGVARSFKMDVLGASYALPRFRERL